MILDITFCTNKECAKKIKCKRYIGHYSFGKDERISQCNFNCDTTKFKRMDYFLPR